MGLMKKVVVVEFFPSNYKNYVYGMKEAVDVASLYIMQLNLDQANVVVKIVALPEGAEIHPVNIYDEIEPDKLEDFEF